MQLSELIFLFGFNDTYDDVTNDERVSSVE